MGKARLVITRQQSLCVIHEADEKTWVLTACTRGVERTIGRKIRKGERVTVEIQVREVK